MAATKPTSASELDQLRAKVAELEGKLAAERTANEESAIRNAFISQSQSEHPTGKKVKEVRLKKMKVVGYTSDGRPMLEPEWQEVEVPTFAYKIDMPAIGGVSIRVNGQDFYHGQVYEFTENELRGIKDTEYRLRAHEASLNGSNENIFRKPSNAVFSGKVNGRVH